MSETQTRIERLTQGSQARAAQVEKYRSAIPKTKNPPPSQELNPQFTRREKLMFAALAGTSILIPTLLSACGGDGESSIAAIQGTSTVEPHRPVAGQTISAQPSEGETPLVQKTPTIPEPEASQTPKAEIALSPIPTSPAEIPTAQPTEVSATPEIQSLLIQIREKIESLGGSSELKAQSLQIVERFETTANILNQFEQAYQKTKTQDGTPKLLAAIKSNFQNLDLSPLWQGKYASESEFLENNFGFFIADNRLLHEEILPTIVKATTPGEINQALSLAQQDFFTENRQFYLEIGQNPLYSLTLTTDPESTQLLGPNGTTAKQDEALVREVLSKFPQAGKWRVTLINSPEVGEHSGATIDGQNTEFILTIDRDASDLEETTAHEASHLLDANISYPILARLYPQEIAAQKIVDLMTLSWQVTAAGELFGARYPVSDWVDGFLNNNLNVINQYSAEEQVSFKERLFDLIIERTRENRANGIFQIVSGKIDDLNGEEQNLYTKYLDTFRSGILTGNSR